MAEFEGKERRMPKIEVCLAENGIASLEEAREICSKAGVDVEALVKGVQPIAFENAVWAYTLGAAIGIKRGVKSAADAARCIGEGLQAFCRRTAPRGTGSRQPGSHAPFRGNKMLRVPCGA